ncbi:ndufv2 [Symbiodinium sp. KB8]|nr:ndufv2 [Symbiodinium sp. KB8]
MTPRSLSDDLSPLGHDHADQSNTEDHAFDFTDANYRVVERVLGKYPAMYKKSAIIPLLDLAQRQCGNFLPLAAMQKVARLLNVSDIEVYEVATFYTMFNRKRVGKFFIQLCGTTPCMVNGSEDIKAAIEEELGIHSGETTPDGMFTLLEVECLGACVNAPMIQVNDDFFECLTPETTRDLLRHCREKGSLPPLTKWGSKPLNGQDSCEGPLGKTSLATPPPVPKRRTLEAKVDPRTVKDTMMY